MNKFWRAFLAVAIFSVGLGLGYLRYELDWRSHPKLSFDFALGQSLKFVGIVVAEPDERENYTRLIVKEEKTGERLLVLLPRFPRFSYGDYLAIAGRLRRPENFITAAGREFDYVNYLAKNGLNYELTGATANLLDRHRGSYLKEKLFQFKVFLINRLNWLLPEPSSSFLGGLLLGAKQALGPEWLDDFRRAGVIHVVVLSGFNLAIVARALSGAFRFLPRLAGVGASASGIILFTLMAGASAATLRAAIMALIALLASWTGRTYLAARALFLAGFLMIIFNPQILVYDLGFQLSCLSTYGLIYFGPLIKARLGHLPDKWGIREGAAATFASQIFVWPWLVYKTGEMSLVSLPANLAIIFLIPVTMGLGFAMLVASFIGQFAVWPLRQLTFGLLHYQLAAVDFFAAWPLAAVNLNMPLVATILVYFGYWKIIKNQLKFSR